jgi:hypothetical protein
MNDPLLVACATVSAICLCGTREVVDRVCRA